MKLAPIALFVYNRPEHTRQTVEALLKNELASESDLFIFSDAEKKFAESRTKFLQFSSQGPSLVVLSDVVDVEEE